eukprot:529951-Amphidinium_carterae.1
MWAAFNVALQRPTSVDGSISQFVAVALLIGCVAVVSGTCTSLVTAKQSKNTDPTILAPYKPLKQCRKDHKTCECYSSGTQEGSPRKSVLVVLLHGFAAIAFLAVTSVQPAAYGVSCLPRVS